MGVRDDVVMPAGQVMVQSMALAAIPAVTMLLGGVYPLVSSRPPSKNLSFALQHFAGKLSHNTKKYKFWT
jgi:hypothetical protein